MSNTDYFKLDSTASLFHVLSQTPNWWKTILGDKNLYINVRKNNRINVYYQGSSVMELHIGRGKDIKARIHRKYLGIKQTSDYITLTPEDIVRQLDEIKAEIDLRKKPKNPEGGTEKALQGLYYLSGKYIDTEYEFVNNEGLITRIDFTSINEDGMIEFVELKRISDNRLLNDEKSTQPEEIIRQMRDYKRFIIANKAQIQDYYQRVQTILKSIHVNNPLCRIPINGVIEDARLLFAGYVDDNVTHYARQKRVQRIKSLLEREGIRSNIDEIQSITGLPK